MNIKIHSSELNRMMKTMVQCIDTRDQRYGNIQIIYDNNLLTIRGTNGSFSAVMTTPILGGDGEVFCVDGAMFARVVGMCSGEVSIITDGKTCTVKGAGRTRLPILDANIPAFEPVSGKESRISAEEFSRGFSSVAYAVSTDQSRVVLTGILLETNGDALRMVALDGFKMAIEEVRCESKDMNIVVPGAFMKLVSASTFNGETITLRTNGKRLQASTDGMMLSCTLLENEFPDYRRILPADFKTETLVKADHLQSALKCGSVVNQSNNLVKLNVAENTVTVMSNSEQADFDAEVGCETSGENLKIAFNHKYLIETINSENTDEIVMKFVSPVSPCIIQCRDGNGLRLLLPVRVVG